MRKSAMLRWGLHSELGATRPGARFDAVVVIPVSAACGAVPALVTAVLKQELRCIVVDAGRDPHGAGTLDELARAHAGVVKLLRLPRSHDKGAAMVTGLREARRRGYTHAIQIDADGRYDPAHIPEFIARARLQPESVICGYAAPGASLAPRWVGIYTLSADIRDPSSGFRVYPLPSAIDVIRRERWGLPLDFDREILVRLHWNGVAIVNHPTAVDASRTSAAAPAPWRRALRMARLHLALSRGLLQRLPALLWRRLRRDGHQPSPQQS